MIFLISTRILQGPWRLGIYILHYMQDWSIYMLLGFSGEVHMKRGSCKAGSSFVLSKVPTHFRYVSLHGGVYQTFSLKRLVHHSLLTTHFTINATTWFCGIMWRSPRCPRDHADIMCCPPVILFNYVYSSEFRSPEFLQLSLHIP